LQLRMSVVLHEIRESAAIHEQCAIVALSPEAAETLARHN